MKHQLIIMRHAKATRDDPSIDDFHRPLSERGLSDISRVAKWLTLQYLHIDQILCSTAKRTRQTAQLLCQDAGKDSGIDSTKIDWRPTLYLADTATLLDTISHTPTNTQQLMVIGHNPGLEALLSYLCGDELPLTNSGQLLTTANIAIVALDDGWDSIKPHSGKLLQLMRSKELEQP